MSSSKLSKHQLYDYLYKDYLSQAEIGRLVGLSRERVRQLINGYGFKYPTSFERWFNNLTPEQQTKGYWLDLAATGNRWYCGNFAEHLGVENKDIVKLFEHLDISELLEPYIPSLFMSQVEVMGPNSCWIWKGLIYPSGYGRFYTPGEKKVDYAHRVSYRLFVGPIPEGKQVNHCCDFCNCIQPKHLYLGTQKDNILDRELRNSNSVTNNPNRLTRSNSVCILLDKGKKVIDIFPSQGALANFLSIDQSLISAHKKGVIKQLKSKYTVRFVEDEKLQQNAR